MAFTAGFHTALLITGGLAVAAGIVALVTLTGPRPRVEEAAPADRCCPLDGPPLRTVAG